MKISTILDQIDVGAMALPQFQRGYVWTRDQVRALMASLYRRYPVGGLLVWVTKTENAKVRGDGQLQPGSIELLLDGQQRVTSLYGIVRGIPPKFFEGKAQTFTGLYFNLEEEIFEFYSAPKMGDNLMWINISDVMKRGIGEFITPFTTKPEYAQKLNDYINRLSKLHDIRDIELHIEQVTGEDKTVDVVVDIFNQVNSGGTKLSKGDLALARVCASWPEARDKMRAILEKWSGSGYNGFKLEWLLRIMNSVITGDAYFSALRSVDVTTIKQGLEKTEKRIDKILNQISSRLGLDHAAVLGSVYSFPVMARYIETKGGNLTDYRQWDKLLYWYIHTLLWGRYAGSTESVMSQDLNILKQSDDPFNDLIAILKKVRGGDLRLNPNDFNSWSVGSRFYPLLYMMTRAQHARDWETGIELTNHLLGKFNRLQVHHIFPKALLYKYGYNRAQVNSIANFTFLTQETNLAVSARMPEEYIPFYEKKQPDSIQSHWIPMDPNLWKPENYLVFLEARRVLLAESANQFLDGLLAGAVPAPGPMVSVLEYQLPLIPGHIEDEMEEGDLNECNGWMVQHDLPAGEFMCELVDSTTGGSLAYLDLAWPEGVQEKYSQPVAILINEAQETLEIANKAGYRCFTTADEFKQYIRREIIGSNNNGQ
jgi:hypothetical protein